MPIHDADALFVSHDTRLDSLDALNSLRAREFRVFRTMTLWQRLRWLLWGVGE